jgi:hypothetical protein
MDKSFLFLFCKKEALLSEKGGSQVATAEAKTFCPFGAGERDPSGRGPFAWGGVGLSPRPS